jgi:hydroxymethylglutaryl-CoA synthase
LYAALLSLVSHHGKKLHNQKAVMFSYGSGLASTMFQVSFHGEEKLSHLANMADVDTLLGNRQAVDPHEFTATLKRREVAYGTFPMNFSAPEIAPRLGMIWLTYDFYA